MRKNTVSPRSFAIALTLAAVLISFLPLVAGAQDSITPPDEFFGHQPVSYTHLTLPTTPYV